MSILPEDDRVDAFLARMETAEAIWPTLTYNLQRYLALTNSTFQPA